MSMYGQSEPVTLARDVKAVVIPAGDETTLAAGRTGFITQALGGSSGTRRGALPSASASAPLMRNRLPSM